MKEINLFLKLVQVYLFYYMEWFSIPHVLLDSSRIPAWVPAAYVSRTEAKRIYGLGDAVSLTSFYFKS